MKTKEEALEKIAELEKKLGLQTRAAEDMERVMTKTIDDYEARLETLSESNKQLQRDGQLVKTLRELIGAPPTGTGISSDQSVEASLRRILGLDGGEKFTLERVKKIFTVKEEKRPMPTYSTLTPEGKIASLVVKGEFDSAKRLKEVEALVPHLSRIEVWKGIEKLIGDGVILEMKTADSHKVYRKDPDIEVE